MNLVKYWNPQVVTHVVDEDANNGKTICGIKLKPGWESGDEHMERDSALRENELDVGCKTCSRILALRRKRGDGE